MIVITCVDNDLGVSFNHRRQSRDRALCQRILERTAGHTLWMNAGSAKLFAGEPTIRVSDHFLEQAGAGEYCFVETDSLAPWRERIEGLLLYRWNRSYPADRKLELKLEEWRLQSSQEFSGHSHERITEEIYCK